MEDVGYNVVPFGVEEVFREVKDFHNNGTLPALPMALKKMPDFIVVSPEKERIYMVEVKYRKCWNEETRAELAEKLKDQLSVWDPIYLMLFIGETVEDLGSSPSQIARISKITMKEDLLYILNYPDEKEEKTFPWDNVEFGKLLYLQSIFKKLDEKKSERTIAKMMPLIKILRDLREQEQIQEAEKK